MQNITKAVGIYTLGCKVNQYESQAISEQAAKYGFEVLAPSSKCDVYIINTCTVTAESDRKARQFIRRAISRNPEAFIIVTGCMAQTTPSEVALIEGVDAIVGNTDNPMRIYLKNARLSLGGDNKLMVVLEDGTPSDYFTEHPENKEQLENIIADFLGKEVEVTIQSVRSRQEFSESYVDLSQIIHMDIEVEE